MRVNSYSLAKDTSGSYSGNSFLKWPGLQSLDPRASDAGGGACLNRFPGRQLKKAARRFATVFALRFALSSAPNAGGLVTHLRKPSQRLVSSV